MQVEGATSKDKVDEFRASNVELLKNLDAFKGVDMEKYKAMLDTDQKLRDKELIAKGDFDTIITERLASTTSDFEAKLAASNATNTTWASKYNTLATKHQIEGAALKAFGDHKIRPDAHDAVLSQIKSKFSIDPEGKAIAKDGDKILTGANGNLTISEFVGSQPDFMRVPNSAGGGRGGEDGGGQKSGSSLDKISSGLKAKLGV